MPSPPDVLRFTSVRQDRKDGVRPKCHFGATDRTKPWSWLLACGKAQLVMHPGCRPYQMVSFTTCSLGCWRERDRSCQLQSLGPLENLSPYVTSCRYVTGRVCTTLCLFWFLIQYMFNSSNKHSNIQWTDLIKSTVETKHLLSLLGSVYALAPPAFSLLIKHSCKHVPDRF